MVTRDPDKYCLNSHKIRQFQILIFLSVILAQSVVTKAIQKRYNCISGSDTWELWSLRSISVSVTFNIMCIWSIPAGDGKRRFSRKYHITQYLKFMNLAVTRMCFLLICRGARPQSKNIVIFMIYFRCSMSTLIFLHCTVWAYVKRVLHVRKGPLTISSHRARTPSYQL